MAENLNPPRIAGRHFFVHLKTMHFGRNGSSNSTTEAAAAAACMRAFVVARVIDTMYQLIYSSAQTQAWRIEFPYSNIREY